MIIQRGDERGSFHNDWLDSKHSFSFGEFYNPDKMGVSTLRVVNDDIIAEKGGFPEHPHENMEIITYVLSGALAHKDSMGNGSTIQSGDVQRMSAGTGIRHSEFNPSEHEPAHILQIWIRPKANNILPSYEQKNFSEEQKRGRLRLIASGDGREESVLANIDASVYAAILKGDDVVNFQSTGSRLSYIHLARGDVRVNGESLSGGDSAVLSGSKNAEITANEFAEVLLFDLPCE